MTWVYFNFIETNDLVKKVDDHKMMITFQAIAIMVWDDPRLKMKSKSPKGPFINNVRTNGGRGGHPGENK